jgi:glutaconate CoA-transferase subunit B
LPGTGGGNDIASLTEMIVAMPQERRRFVEQVDFVTSPGFLKGGSSRKDAGLISGGMYKVVTDLAILGFDAETGRMQVEALHARVTPGQVQENTGFELVIRPDIDATEPPSQAELTALRHLDPDRIYTA